VFKFPVDIKNEWTITMDIILLLGIESPMKVGDIASQSLINRPVISPHLKALKLWKSTSIGF
jgi:hypothetical protein